jgi:hypothetical protein
MQHPTPTPSRNDSYRTATDGHQGQNDSDNPNDEDVVVGLEGVILEVPYNDPPDRNGPDDQSDNPDDSNDEPQNNLACEISALARNVWLQGDGSHSKV